MFNMTDSKANLVLNSSLPRMSNHIYALQKGLYGSSHDSFELTRAQSLPTNTP